MRIVIDGSHLYNVRQGQYKYVVSLLPHFARMPGVQVVVTQSPAGVFNSVDCKGVDVRRRYGLSFSWLPLGPIRRPLSHFRRFLQDQRLHWEASRRERDIFHSHFYVLPPSERYLYVPSALDTIPEKLGGEILAATSPDLLRAKREAFQRADHIVAISEQTRADVCEVYGIVPDRISTVPLAADRDFFSAPATDETERQVRAKLGFDGPYFLQVGGRMHHKNFTTLAEGFAESKLPSDYHLVCVGEPWGPHERRMLVALGIENRTSLFPGASEEELRALYQGATALVYPSLNEGFGFPLAEAMAAGTAIAASSIPVMKEVGGSAGEYFDPNDPSSLARAMRALTNPVLRAERIAAGNERAELFTWQRTAQGLAEVFERVARAGK